MSDIYDLNPKNVIAERNKALSNLDMDWARQKFPDAKSDYIRLMAMHKARYECVTIAAELRHISAQWMRDNGVSRMYGLALLPDGELPE